jgi:hypothetical protein
MTLAKFWMALSAAVGVMGTLMPDGLNGSDWVTVALAFLGAAGVYAVPNDTKDPDQ